MTPRGFTLVEILIVVVILGILAAIITPQFAGATADAKQSAFISSLKTYASNAEYFMISTGNPIGDTSTGQLPTNGFEDFIDQIAWVLPTPIGGSWDTENDRIGVHFNGAGDTRDAAFMAEIDAILDDGDLSTGSFQQVGGDRYYFLLSSS